MKQLSTLVIMTFFTFQVKSQCFPSVTTSGMTNDYIDFFLLNGLLCSAPTGDDICDYTIGDWGNNILSPGNTATFSVQFGSTCTNQYVSIWLDDNGDQMFSASEILATSISPGSGSVPFTGTFTIPITAVNGYRSLRVATKQGSAPGATEICTLNGAGEYHDYLVYIGAPSTCTGVPANANIDFTSCDSGSIHKVFARLNPMYNETGYTYQWERADDAAFTVNVVAMNPSLNSKPYIIFETPNTNFYLRCIITCTNSNLSNWTPPTILPLISIPTALQENTLSEMLNLDSKVFNQTLSFSLTSRSAQHGYWYLVNQYGQVVKNELVGGETKLNWSTSHLAAGPYYLCFRSKEKDVIKPIRLLKVD